MFYFMVSLFYQNDTKAYVNRAYDNTDEEKVCTHTNRLHDLFCTLYVYILKYFCFALIAWQMLYTKKMAHS